MNVFLGRLYSHLISILGCLAFLGVCYGQFHFFNSPTVGTAHLPWQPWWLLFAALTLLLLSPWLVLPRRWRSKLPEIHFSWWMLPCCAALILATDISSRRFSFYVDSDSRWLVLILGACIGLIAWLRWRNERVADGCVRFFSLPLLFIFQALTAVYFLQLADGRVIFSDDHPSFWYRLYLLQQQFPLVPFYSGDWEAGYSAREFFASGVLNFYFLTLPFWYSGVDLTQVDAAVVYNYAILFVFVFLIPLSVYVAARILSLSPALSSIAGILALGPTNGQFEWLLKYGTLGFCCAVGFLPLALALIYRFVFAEKAPPWYLVPALLFVSFLCISWSLMIFAFVPAAVLALYQWRHTFADSRRRLVFAFIAIFLCVNVPWMKVFVEESKVFSFVSKTAMPGAVAHERVATEKSVVERKQSTARELLQHARELIAKVNPLIVLLAVPGVALLNSRQRLLWGASMGFLLFLAFFGEAFKPQLELRRMIIPAMFLSCIPVALAFNHLVMAYASFLQQPHRVLKLSQRAVFSAGIAILTGMLLLSPITVAAVYQNRSDEQFRFAPEILQPLAESIVEHGGQGRTFFLGFILQELGASDFQSQDGGHIAILAALTGKPLYAHYYYHSRWETIDPIPRAYRDRGPEGIEAFLDLLNVTAVVTFKQEWARYAREHPHYTEVVQHERFRIFTRRPNPAGYFMQGQGSIRELRDGFELTPLSQEIKLRYRYLPKLRSEVPDGVEIYSFPAFIEDTGVTTSHTVEFIGLRIAPEHLGKPIRFGYWVAEKK